MSNLFYRIILLCFTLVLFFGFMNSVTEEKGYASFYPAIIPILGGMAINFYLPKLGKGHLVFPTAIILIVLATIFFKFGGFVSYTAWGLATCIVLFHALRPWED